MNNNIHINNNILKIILNRGFLFKYIWTLIIVNILLFIINSIYDIYQAYIVDILDWGIIWLFLQEYINNQGMSVLVIMLFTLNILLYIEYIKLQRKLVITKNKSKNIFVNIKEGVIVIFTVLSTCCLSCGFVLFGGIINLSLLTGLPWFSGNFIYFVLLLIIVNIYYLYKKLNNPYVC